MKIFVTETSCDTHGHCGAFLSMDGALAHQEKCTCDVVIEWDTDTEQSVFREYGKCSCGKRFETARATEWNAYNYCSEACDKNDKPNRIAAEEKYKRDANPCPHCGMARAGGWAPSCFCPANTFTVTQ